MINRQLEINYICRGEFASLGIPFTAGAREPQETLKDSACDGRFTEVIKNLTDFPSIDSAGLVGRRSRAR